MCTEVQNSNRPLGVGTANAIALRRSTLEELPILHAMERQPHAVPFVTATDLTEHAERLLDPACVYLSVENYLILNLDPDGTSIEFRRIVIDAGARGIGQPVIRHMESFCRSELGASRVWLDVYHDNERARHVYEKLGFSRFREQNFGGRLLIYYQKRL